MRRGLAAALAAVMVITAVPSAATAQESHLLPGEKSCSC